MRTIGPPTTAATTPTTVGSTITQPSTTAPASTTTGKPTTTVTPTTAAAIDTHIMVYGNCKTPSVEPTEIILACADANAVLEQLHWTGWTATSATAVGTFVYND